MGARRDWGHRDGLLFAPNATRLRRVAMRIVDLVHRDMILPALAAANKTAIIQELANHLASQHSAINADTLASVLANRESLASTAIGEGVAIPHAKLPSLEKIVACIGRATQGVDFDSVDGEPTYLFFVMVAPENSTGMHLKALARISRVFRDVSFRRQLLQASDAGAMYDIIVAEDAKY